MEPWAAGLLGVLITVTIGLLGASIQSRREHKKWLREQRFQTYIEFSTYMHRLRLARERFERSGRSDTVAREEREYERGLLARGEALHLEEATKAMDEWSTAWDSRIGIVERLRLLGPRSVHDAADALMAAGSDDANEVKRRESALDVAMRHALHIRDFGA